MIPGLIKAIIVAVSVIIGVGTTLFFKMKPDNPVEEVAEVVIKNETGVDVDLTPSTPETTQGATEKDNDQDISGAK